MRHCRDLMCPWTSLDCSTRGEGALRAAGPLDRTAPERTGFSLSTNDVVGHPQVQNGPAVRHGTCEAPPSTRGADVGYTTDYIGHIGHIDIEPGLNEAETAYLIASRGT